MNTRWVKPPQALIGSLLATTPVFTGCALTLTGPSPTPGWMLSPTSAPRRAMAGTQEKILRQSLEKGGDAYTK